MSNASFEAGSRVRLKHDPGRIGVVNGKTRQYGAVRRWRIVFPEGAQYVPGAKRPRRTKCKCARVWRRAVIPPVHPAQAGGNLIGRDSGRPPPGDLPKHEVLAIPLWCFFMI